MADRVRHPQQFKEFLTELTDKEIFKTYKDALVFAACLGFNRGKRVPFDKSSEPIRLDIFSGNFDEMVINTLAIAETEDPFVMAKSKEDEKIKILEEYACGGLEIMQNELAQSQIKIDEGLLDMILREEDSGGILDEIKSLADL